MQVQHTPNKPMDSVTTATTHCHGGSGGSFSFPSTPNQDDFEFGSLTPDSPSSGDPSRGSPADHLFFNGRLLPHSFPPPLSGATSRTSSLQTTSSSSLSTSRSNSTNSSCSSARTSSSDCSERKLFHNHNRLSSSLSSLSSPPGGRAKYNLRHGSKMAAAAYGSSQRWQYIITPVPVPVPAALTRDASRRRKEETAKKKKKKKKEEQRFGIGRRLLRWLVMACKECHALEPSRKEKKMSPPQKREFVNL